MHRFFAPLIGTCVFLLGNPSYAQTYTTQTSKPWANKFFLPDTDANRKAPPPDVISHDFQSVPFGTLCTHKFTITNIYDVPLQVLAVRRSCGCVQAYPPERVLQPNETADFVVTMDTGKFKGKETKTIHVTFGPQYVSEAKLQISATSSTDVVLNPGEIQFGSVEQGKESSSVVELKYQGQMRDWKLLEKAESTGPISVEVRDSGRDSGGRKFYVMATLKSSAPPGPFSDIITLRTNDPTAPIIRVNASGVIQAPLSVSLSKVNISGVKVGEVGTFKVIVRSSGSSSFRIEPIPDAGDGISIETFPKPGPIQVVTVKYQPTQPKQISRDVVLKSDLNNGASVKIHIDATSDAAPPTP